jgi:hypothetical protein
MNRFLIAALLLLRLPSSAQEPASTPTWTQLTNLPAAMTTSGTSLYAGSDGYLYAGVLSGQSHVISVFRTLASDPTSWTDITGKGLPAAQPIAAGLTPNGTLLISTTRGKGNADIYAWNGSTSTPVWSRVKGWDGESSSWIYGFTNDSAGYTYFSPAWSGDIWRSDHPGSLHFNQIVRDLYGITGGGASDHPETGGIYQLKVWDLGDGKGDMIWACGEGELDSISLKFKKTTNTAYLSSAQGYRGNCTSLAKSATTILAFRTGDAAVDTLSSIDIATRAVTIHPSPNPRTATSFPPNISTNEVGILHWMTGTTFMVSAIDASRSPSYLLLSSDDGATWVDITASGGIDSSCTGANLSAGAAADSHYIFARCQNGRVIWKYGPVE